MDLVVAEDQPTHQEVTLLGEPETPHPLLQRKEILVALVMALTHLHFKIERVEVVEVQVMLVVRVLMRLVEMVAMEQRPLSQVLL